MASQHRKHRGYKTQRNVADFFKESGWNNAYSIGAGQQGSDIQGVPFDVEVKAVANLSIPQVLKQVEARTEGLGFAVARLNGQGDDASKYAVITRLDVMVNLLKRAGYNKSEKPEPVRCNQCGGWTLEGLECLTCQNTTTNA
jgi:hypothetical protein